MLGQEARGTEQTLTPCSAEHLLQVRSSQADETMLGVEFVSTRKRKTFISSIHYQIPPPVVSATKCVYWRWSVLLIHWIGWQKPFWKSGTHIWIRAVHTEPELHFVARQISPIAWPACSLQRLQWVHWGLNGPTMNLFIGYFVSYILNLAWRRTFSFLNLSHNKETETRNYLKVKSRLKPLKL